MTHSTEAVRAAAYGTAPTRKIVRILRRQIGRGQASRATCTAAIPIDCQADLG